jgi:hypothetical protein
MHITFQDAHRAVKEAVKAKGEDYVYMNPTSAEPDAPGPCSYVHGDTPGCIVGHALHNLGVSIDLLRAMDCSDEPIIDTAYELELVPAGVTMTEKAIQFFTAAQMHQDMRARWGEALRAAELATADLTE